MGSPSRVWMLIRNLISSHVASVGKKKISAIKNVPSSGKGFVSLCTSLQEWDPGVIISPRGWGILRALQPRPGDVPSSGKGMENPQIPPSRDVLPARTCCGILGFVCPECRRWERPHSSSPWNVPGYPCPHRSWGSLAGIDETLGVENNLPKSWRIGTAQNGDGPGVKNTQLGVRDTPAMDTRDVPALGQNPPNLNQRSPVFKPKFFHI